MSRIARHFEKSLGAGAEQESVEDLFVLQHQWSQAVGQCEDHVQVAGREKFSSTRSDPAVPSSGLTLGAMAIAAAVIGDGGTMSAAGALIEMTAESGGTTTPNGPQYFHVLPTEPMAVSFDERLSGSADDVGHLQRRPAHLVLVRRLVVQR